MINILLKSPGNIGTFFVCGLEKRQLLKKIRVKRHQNPIFENLKIKNTVDGLYLFMH